MTIYRYEMADGGGPWMTFDGFNRAYPQDPRFPDDYLAGFTSIDGLNNYMEEFDGRIDNCSLKEYDIPYEELTFHPACKGEVSFPKRYHKYGKQI